VVASGDGVIKYIGREGGYGNVIVIRHDQTYSTIYAHMSHFFKGISAGMHIKEGQTIGYVGATGLATGPHLHYEFRINNRPVDPMTVTLPHTYSLSRAQLRAYIEYARRVMNALA
jgi:murein DD-endopeptidase MepM/ murein hydrolase activator NlpD